MYHGDDGLGGIDDTDDVTGPNGPLATTAPSVHHVGSVGATALAALGQDKFAVHKLFVEVAPRYAQRDGGYTRILKMGFRVGDNAPMAFVELVDRPAPAEADAVAE